MQPTSDEIDRLLPNRFSKQITRALETKNVNANIKSAMCRKVVENLVDSGKSNPAALKKAAKRMAFKWSPLKNPYDPAHVRVLS